MYISSFAISGYRSLKNVEITGMLRICIFHGLNNSGKSNILSAMEMIFSRKLLVEETTSPREVARHQRRGSLWQGQITDFRDNFYGNGKGDITFSVSVTFSEEEIAFLKEILKELHPSLGRTGHDKVLTLSGKIGYVDEDTADMALERVVFNKSHVVFEVDGTGKKSFLPKLSKLTAEQRLAYFEQLMNLLADSFVLLSSDRYLTTEAAGEEDKQLALSPKTFKNWLFKLSLTRAGHVAFEEIKAMFGKPPFLIGEIGFGKESGQIEIMVQEPKVRLPIGRLGSGYQQILYIIANLILNKGKMLGIEELEINLSPMLQKVLFEKLKNHVYKATDLASQIIITSHSDYFDPRRQDVRTYAVEHNGDYTVVNKSSPAKRKDFFRGAWYTD